MKNLTVIAVDESTVRITFEQNEEEARFIEGYKISWSPNDGDGRWQETETKQTTHTLDSLRSNTQYEIVVTPHTSQQRRNVQGAESRKAVLTQLPGE